MGGILLFWYALLLIPGSVCTTTYIHKTRHKWDDEKNEINKKKHGIYFETATLVFDDAFCVTFIDRESRGEERWHTIGSIGNIIVIVVVHTYRAEGLDEVIRIIPDVLSAMKGSYMPRLTAEERKKPKRLAARPDREIDLSDIPEIRELPSDAVIGKFYKPRKASVTIRIDADVLA